MQKQMENMQKELEEKEVEASAGGGAVTAIVNGKKELLNIQIDESVVDPEDIEMLQDLVLAAVNEALRKAEDMVSSEMQKNYWRIKYTRSVNSRRNFNGAVCITYSKSHRTAI